MTPKALLRLGIALAGCASLQEAAARPLAGNQQVLDIISVCSAGYSLTLSAGLTADLLGLVKGKAALSASAVKTIQGQFIATSQVTEERAVELYESYVGCVQSEQSTAELIAILAQRRKKIDETLQSKGQAAVAQKFDWLYATYVQEVQNNQKVAAHETGRDIQILLANAAEQVKAETGETVDVLFSKYEDGPKDLQKRAASKPAKPTQCASRRAVREEEFSYHLTRDCPKLMDRVPQTPGISPKQPSAWR